MLVRTHVGRCNSRGGHHVVTQCLGGSNSEASHHITCGHLPVSIYPGGYRDNPLPRSKVARFLVLAKYIAMHLLGLTHLLALSPKHVGRFFWGHPTPSEAQNALLSEGFRRVAPDPYLPSQPRAALDEFRELGEGRKVLTPVEFEKGMRRATGSAEPSGGGRWAGLREPETSGSRVNGI